LLAYFKADMAQFVLH